MSVSLTDFLRLCSFYYVVVSYRYDVGTDKSFLSPCSCVFGGRIRHSDTLSVGYLGVFLHFSRVTSCHVDNFMKKSLDIIIYSSYILNVEKCPKPPIRQYRGG